MDLFQTDAVLSSREDAYLRWQQESKTRQGGTDSGR